MTVWSRSAWTGCPLMKISGIPGVLHVQHAIALGALVLDPVFEFIAELGDDADRRIARRVAHAADRRPVVGVGDRDQAVDVARYALAVDDAVDDRVHPAHAFAARRALAAGFVVVEAQHHL